MVAGGVDHHIATNRHARVGAAPNNFPTTLARSESDLAREIVQDPYDLDFLAGWILDTPNGSWRTPWWPG